MVLDRVGFEVVEVRDPLVRRRPSSARRTLGIGLALLGALLGTPFGAHAGPTHGQDAKVDPAWIESNYSKREVMVPMRDGVALSTSIYTPRHIDATLPILMKRTPYGCRPYGESSFPGSLGPNDELARKGYIFVYQDVRGCYRSEGEFTNMTPHVPDKTSAEDIDESSDAFDTIEWLMKNVPGHNGRVGMWGISYPGFYCAASMIDHHPALVAVSPQAPIADWWYDDFHHHGAFFLPHCYNFIVRFGQPRPEPTTNRSFRFDHGTRDGYQYFLDLGPLSNAKDEMKDVAFWHELIAHPNRDEYWQRRDILPHLSNVAPAVMTVGGWFDAEDLYGPLQIYRSIEEKNPDSWNVLVMGPWRHGGWSRTSGERLGNVHFGSETSRFYHEQLEVPFFEHFLRGEVSIDIPEASVFETGRNQWRSFSEWPPASVEERELYFEEEGRIYWPPRPVPSTSTSYDEFVSDPEHPVPFTEAVALGMTREYMTDDQRFAARRPDVLTWRSPPLPEAVTLAGPVIAELFVSTTGEDADWVVKLCDEFPGDAPEPPAPGDPSELGSAPPKPMSGYMMMVRSEVIRGRFREDPAVPKPFVPNEITRVDLPLQDVLHTFEKGHRIVVQIQSTWFPLVDRNPQTWVDNIFEAEASDFRAQTHRVHRSQEHPSRLRVGVLPQTGGTRPR